MHAAYCSHPTLDDHTALQAAFGATADISFLLCFKFFQPVLYYAYNSPFHKVKNILVT